MVRILAMQSGCESGLPCEGGGRACILTGFVMRWVAAYAVLFSLPFPLDLVPVIGAWTDSYYESIRPVISAIGGIVGATVTSLPNGSGDTTFNYLLLLACALIGALVAGAWTAIGGLRRMGSGASGIRVVLRYYVATVMLQYGVAKILVQQFPVPSAERLMTTYGESSPMGLLWTCLGYSPAYTIVGGAMEALGGVLLLTRRTTLAGVLVLLPVLTNVVLLNVCYDVPVKIYSGHLLLFCVWIGLPDIPGLVRWVLGFGPARPRAASAAMEWARGDPRGRARGVWAGRVACKSVYVICMGVSLYSDVRYDPAAAARAAAGGVGGGELGGGEEAGGGGVPNGSYEIDYFERDGVPVAFSLAEPERWRVFSIYEDSVVSIRRMDGSRVRYLITRLTADHATLAPFGAPGAAGQPMRFRRIEPDRIEIEFAPDSAPALRARGRFVDPAATYLMSRGFHWINETPNNR